MVNPHTGPTPRKKSLGVLGKVLPGLAYQVNDRLSICVTLGVGIGQVELQGPFYVQTGPLAAAPMSLDLQATGDGGGRNLGRPMTPNTTLGIAYTEESRFVFEGTNPPCHPSLR